MDMSKAVLALWAAMIGTAGSLFMAGWGAHAGAWWIVIGSGCVGLAGVVTLGFMAWIFILD